MISVGSRLALALLLVFAAAGMVVQGGSVPHVHALGQPGLYNEEHDLTLLAGMAGKIVAVDAASTVAFDTITTAVTLSLAERPVLRLARSGDSRAPPLR